IVRTAGLETQLGKPRRIASRFHELLLLNAEFAEFAISHQSIRDVAEGALDGLLIGQEQLFVLRLGQANTGLQSPAFKNRLRDAPDQSPRSSRAGKQVGELRAFESSGPCQRNLREISSSGDTDLRIGRD